MHTRHSLGAILDDRKEVASIFDPRLRLPRPKGPDAAMRRMRLIWGLRGMIYSSLKRQFLLSSSSILEKWQRKMPLLARNVADGCPRWSHLQ